MLYAAEGGSPVAARSITPSAHSLVEPQSLHIRYAPKAGLPVAARSMTPSAHSLVEPQSLHIRYAPKAGLPVAAAAKNCSAFSRRCWKCLPNLDQHQLSLTMLASPPR